VYLLDRALEPRNPPGGKGSAGGKTARKDIDVRWAWAAASRDFSRQVTPTRIHRRSGRRSCARGQRLPLPQKSLLNSLMQMSVEKLDYHVPSISGLWIIGLAHIESVGKAVPHVKLRIDALLNELGV